MKRTCRGQPFPSSLLLAIQWEDIEMHSTWSGRFIQCYFWTWCEVKRNLHERWQTITILFHQIGICWTKQTWINMDHSRNLSPVEQSMSLYVTIESFDCSARLWSWPDIVHWQCWPMTLCRSSSDVIGLNWCIVQKWLFITVQIFRIFSVLKAPFHIPGALG